MKREIASIVFMLMLFVSMLFSSLPLVSAVITVENPYMPPEIKGDFNCDGRVDYTDAFLFSKAYNSGKYHPLYDLNNDGVIDYEDAAIFRECYLAGVIEDLPIAYSTAFDFTVPDDGNNEVWYYVLARVYVPSGLSGQHFYFVASADDSIQHVKLDALFSKVGSGSSVNIDLGTLSSGYHLIEFEFVEVSGGGWLNFHVATATGNYAWLSRFRIYVPNYSENTYEYTVETQTNFPIDDWYFLKGFADDFINEVYVDGLKWQDWEWNCTPYDTIYAWGDGFCYPLGERIGWRNIIFTFGEIWEVGLLDFQYVSWTNQKAKIGEPRFCAVGSLNEGNYITINSATFYGGSKWKFEEDPEFSERYFEARQVINASYNDGRLWVDACFEIGLGLG